MLHHKLTQKLEQAKPKTSKKERNSKTMNQNQLILCQKNTYKEWMKQKAGSLNR
jgi:hypothetical protein